MLLERDKDLKRLQSLVKEAQLGQGGVALVSGEAGIGKTQVLKAFTQAVQVEHGDKIEIAWGGSDPLLTPRALGPLRDMAKSFSVKVKNMIADNVEAGLLFDALLEFLTRRDKTYILVFEDLHWADHASLDLLKFLGRRIAYLKVLIVLSYRSDEIDKAHPLSEVLASLPVGKTTHIELQPLSLDGVRSLLEMSKGVVQEQELHQITSGNPFFVTELLASKQDSLTSVPASIRAAVSARINRLSKEEQSFLETISLIPNAATIQLLDKLFEENAETYVATCVGLGLLKMSEDNAYRFRHELARIGTLERVSAFEKKRLHALILEALLELEKPYPLAHIVHHASGALDAKRVLEFAPLAAQAASNSGSHREAASHLSTAIRFIDSAESEQAAQLYESWAHETSLTVGIDDEVIDARRHAISLWRALDNKVKVGENMRWLSRLLRRQGKAAESLRYLDESIKVLEEADVDADASTEQAMAYSLRSQFHMLNDQMEEAIAWGEKALNLEKTFNDPAVRVHALNNIGSAKAFRGDKEGLDNLLDSLHVSLENNFHVDAARAYTNLAESALKYKKFPLAESTIADGVAYCTKHDLDAWIYYLVAHQANVNLQQGKYSKVQAMTEGVLKLEHITLLMKLPSLLVLSRMYSQTRHIAARKFLDQALEDARAIDEVQHVIPARIALIEYAWFNGHINNALEQLTALYEIDETQLDAWMLGELVIWGKRLDVESSYTYVGKLPEPYLLELNGQLDAAADAWLELNMPYAAAQVLANNKNPQTYQLFARALKILEPIGASALAAKVFERAKHLGVSDKLKQLESDALVNIPVHPLGFTPKEQAIFNLMVAGKSDAEITLALNESKKRLEQHVFAILKKMNVANRLDAMLRVQNEPWLVMDEVVN